MRRKIIHLQNWEINSMIEALPIIKSQGFTAVLTSVFQGKKTNSKQWYWPYQPLDMAFVDSDLGTKEQYKRLCSESHKIGLEVYTDVVLRHIASSDYDKLKPHPKVNPRLLKYIKPVGDCYDYNNRQVYTELATGLPMLDYNSKDLQQIYINFLDELISYGCDGFRIDSCKHHKLPCEGSNFIHIFDRYKDKFIMGECVFENKWILDEYAKYIHVLSESPTSDRNRTVYYFESHDSYYPEAFGYTNRMDDRTRINEYRIIIEQLNSQNTLYYSRPFETLWMSEEIRKINLK